MVCRKCAICKENVDISNPFTGDFLSYTTGKKAARKYVHEKCFLEYYTSEKRRKPMTESQCRQKMMEYRQVYQEQLKEKESKDNLYRFIMAFYDMSYLPSYLYVRFAQVFNGTYKGLNKPITPDELLDMWYLQTKYLRSVCENNRRKGKSMDGVNLIFYDLAILLSKYDSYLKWKSKQTISADEVKKSETAEKEELIRNYNLGKTQTQKKKKKTNDIASMIDEI